MELELRLRTNEQLNWLAAFFSSTVSVFHPAQDEIMDAVAPTDIESQVITVVSAVENCRIRKSGLEFLMYIHVVVNNVISIKNI